MMVNEMNENSTPWQSTTIPKQMPWMSSYQANTYEPLQFGIQATTIPSTTTTITPTAANINIHNFNQLMNHTISPNLTPLNTPTIQTSQQRQKRTSIEMEQDEQQMMTDSFDRDQGPIISEDIPPLQPPKKQVLTERKLFKKFGSLHLDPNLSHSVSPNDSDDSDEDNRDTSTSTRDQGREEFQRYVYLLYKDSKSRNNNHDNNYPMSNSLAAIDRLAREEREKLSKALVLWNPPVENRFNIESSLPRDNEYNCDGDVSSNGSSDDDMTYTDHTDFLKKSYGSNSSVEITDVTNELCNPSIAINDDPSCVDPDDLMMD